MLKINTTSPLPKNQRLTAFPTNALTRQPEISKIDESNNIFSDNLGNIFSLYAFTIDNFQIIFNAESQRRRGF